MAVAMCAGDADVQLCVRWARDQRQTFAIRSGGHNYAGFSTTTGLLIDVKPMNGIRIDAAAGTVWLQAGANNQHIANALGGTPFAVPTGRRPTVGVSGLVLGGGWGFAATHGGLTCDNLLASDIVLADARTVTATSGGDTDDLFWGLRGGGGGNFGVNTSFTFRLHDVSAPVTIFRIVWPGEKQVELLTMLQKMQHDFSQMISSRIKVLPKLPDALPCRDQLLVTTLGQFFGPMSEAMEALAPALALVNPIARDVREMSYWRARDYLVTDDPNGMYDLRSAFVAEALSAQGLETMLQWMTKWPGGSQLQENLGILFAIGGKVREVRPDATAYVHRNANYIFEAEVAWEPIDRPEVVQRQRAWLTEYFAAIQPFLLPQSYVNFPNRDLDLPGICGERFRFYAARPSN
jgi:FAD/FMN-containing dehydrogenase